MVRTRGSDRRPRKSRSDKGKRRKTYAGSLCQHKSKKYYPKIHGRKSAIKIWVWRIETMSHEALKRWDKNIRLKVSQQVWIPQKGNVYVVPVSEIEDKEKLGRFITDRYYEGTWAIMGFTNKKNKYHCSPKCKAIIVIKETPKGNVVKDFQNRGMYRYWFWKG